MKTLVDLLRENARLTNNDLAVMLGKTPEEIEKEIAELENEGLIIGYSAIIDEERYNKNCVTAFIELKVSPQAERGYDDIAIMLSQYKEVDSVYLMSGSYDLLVLVEARTLKELALFVSEKLSPLDTVTGTATSFVLKRYKQDGVIFVGESADKRMAVSP